MKRKKNTHQKHLKRTTHLQILATHYFNLIIIQFFLNELSASSLLNSETLFFYKYCL